MTKEMEDKIIEKLRSKFEIDKVGFILACEEYRWNNELFNRICEMDEYKKARIIVKGCGG